MTVTDHNSTVQLRSSQFSVTVILAIFLNRIFFHIHFSVVICDFLVISSQITIVPMHVPFKIHYRNNLIDKKDSYQIPRPPSWDDRNYSYGHQLYPSGFCISIQFRFTMFGTVPLIMEDTCTYLCLCHLYLMSVS